MIRFLSILLSTITFLAAAEKTSTPAAQTNLPPQYNFLFVVDTSGSMGQEKVLSANLVRWGIFNGFLGQAQEGDSIDIWTYDDENHITRYPPQIVGSQDPKQMALAAGRFIEGLKFRGRSLFQPVATDLNLLMPHTKGLLVMIITDGEEPISGVSVDIDINEHIAREKKESPNSRDPYLISFAVVNGRITQWTVHHGDKELQLANLPERPKPAPVIAKVEGSPRKKEKKTEPPVVFDLPPGAQIVGTAPLLNTEPEDNNPITSLDAALSLHEQEPLVPTETPATLQAGLSAHQSAFAAKTNAVVLAAKAAKKLSASSNPATKPDAKPDQKHDLKAGSVAAVRSTASPTVQNTSPNSKAATVQKPVPTNNAAVAAVAPIPPSKITISPQSVATTPAKKPVADPAPSTTIGMPSIPASAIYLALLAGLISIALGVVMLLRKSKARHTGSIISRSLQQ